MQIMQGTNGDGPRGFRLDPTQTSFLWFYLLILGWYKEQREEDMYVAKL